MKRQYRIEKCGLCGYSYVDNYKNFAKVSIHLPGESITVRVCERCIKTYSQEQIGLVFEVLTCARIDLYNIRNQTQYLIEDLNLKDANNKNQLKVMQNR